MRFKHSRSDFQPGRVKRTVVIEGDQAGFMKWRMRADSEPLWCDGSIAAMGRIYRAEAATSATVAIVVSRFNEPLTQQLLDGALARLREYEGSADVYWVPGAFEIPQACSWLLEHSSPDAQAAPMVRPRYSGICTLGCLIRGETDHYSLLASEVTRRLGELSCSSQVPIAFGVLTCRTMEQAAERADPSKEDKGGEVMGALLEMIDLREALG
ncbi:MAG: 6,7-dimethyl-8-ribityllumazine synthase [bacterium]|nr:6,7-dimethyl-8-ribityllumazine synthase [bacterium]